jgi:hypothetical protein
MNKVDSAAERQLLDVRTAAVNFRQHLVLAGLAAGDIQHSVNRNGDKSSYFEVWGTNIHRQRIRVSDHLSFTADRERDVTVLVDEASAEKAIALIAEMEDGRDRSEAKRKASEEARDAREAPHKAAYLATDKQHVRGDIIAKLYPNVSRADRQEIAKRWLKG